MTHSLPTCLQTFTVFAIYALRATCCSVTSAYHLSKVTRLARCRVVLRPFLRDLLGRLMRPRSPRLKVP